MPSASSAAVAAASTRAVASARHHSRMLGPEPEMVAPRQSPPSARARMASSPGTPAARWGSCRRSASNGGRSSRRPSTRASVRPTALASVTAASARGTISGNAWRALSVEVRHSGMTTTKARSAGTGTGRAVGPGPTATSPPVRQAAALSAWPSISVARASRSSGVQRRPPRALAAIRPEQTAADEEPRPRPSGIRLRHSTARPSRLPRPDASARQTRFEASSASSPAPSPVTRTLSGPGRR